MAGQGSCGPLPRLASQSNTYFDWSLHSDDHVEMLQTNFFAAKGDSVTHRLFHYTPLSSGDDTAMVWVAVLSSLAVLLFSLLLLSAFAMPKRNRVSTPRNGDSPAYRPESQSSSESVFEGIAVQSAFIGIMGNFLEWFEFGLYGVFAADIGESFFTSGDRHAEVALSFLCFGGAFAIRPFGGLFLGYLGDRFGRVVALKISLAMMIFSTAAMGLLPPKQFIGHAAPVLLVTTRLLQGLSLGGQVPGAIVFMMEKASPMHKGFVSSMVAASLLMGLLSSSAVAAMLHAYVANKERWRYAFILTAALGAVSLWLGWDATEPDEYKEASAEVDEKQFTLYHSAEGVYTHWAECLQLVIGGAILGCSTYLLFTWMPTYQGSLRSPPHLPNAWATNTAAMGVYVLLLLFWGWVADHGNYSSLMLGGSLCVAIIATPLFVLFGHTSSEVVFACYILLAIPLTAVNSNVYQWVIERIPDAKVRYATIGIAWGLSMAIFGGPVPFIATKLVKTPWALASDGLYLTILALMATIVYALTLGHRIPQRLQ